LRGILTPPPHPPIGFLAAVALLNSPAEKFTFLKKKNQLILWGRLFTPSTTSGGPSAPPGGAGDAFGLHLWGAFGPPHRRWAIRAQRALRPGMPRVLPGRARKRSRVRDRYRRRLL
jgi:hypothetical protein